MGTGYTRNDTSNNISDGNIINSADLDGEFDAIVTAFSTSGHTHDGTAAEGGPITFVGPVQDFVVSASEVKPKTTNTLSIGTSVLQFKDLYIDGKAYIDGLGETILVDTDKKIEFRDNAIYINSSVNGQLDIDADAEVEITTTTLDINATTTDVSGALTIAGALTASGGGSLTGTWSDLGTVTTVDINGGTIDGSVINATPIGGTTAAAGSFTTLAASGALTTGTSLNINSSTTVTGIRNSSTLSGASASATHLATEQAIKTYVDNKVATVDTLSEILALGNTTGSNNIVVSSGQAITTNTINETTAASGVTIDGVLLKDGGVTTSGSSVLTGNLTGNVTGNLTGNVTGNVTSTGTSTFTTVDINGGAIDGTSIGSSSTSSGAFTTLSASSTATLAASTHSGTATFNNDVTFDGATAGYDVVWDRSDNRMEWADNAAASFGASADLEIKHDGTHSYITDQGTGNLKISASQIDFLGGADGAETMATMVDNGAVTLYYDNAAKLATSTSGVSITGNITVSGTVDGRDVATDGTKLDTISTNANYITNNNQLTNGAGYVTSSGVTSVATSNGLTGGTITSTGTLSMSGSYSGTFTPTHLSATNVNFTGNLQEDGTSLAPSYSGTATSTSTGKGYTRLPGGLILQWGFQYNASGAQTITYPLTFPNRVISVNVTATRTSNAGLGSMDNAYIGTGAIGTGSRSSFVVYWSSEGNGMCWSALGN